MKGSLLRRVNILAVLPGWSASLAGRRLLLLPGLHMSLPTDVDEDLHDSFGHRTILRLEIRAMVSARC